MEINMSKPEEKNRKILIAKRHGSRNSSQSSHYINNNISQGTKRYHEDNTSSPPNKKHLCSTYLTPPPSFTKNLAARRLENLRKSLEIKRRSEENSEFNNRRESMTISSPISSTSTVKPNTFDEIKNESNVDNFMDWAEINEDTIINNINEIRKELTYHPTVSTPCEENVKSFCIHDGIFIVVDTNIFLSQLTFLSKLKEKILTDAVVIIVPWMVIQELDYMKESHSSKSMSISARTAVNYINSQLSSNNPHFKGQSVREAAKYDLSSKNPDDGILFCCLQLVDNKKNVVLLSNDVNLRNKALINKIRSYSSTDIIEKLNQKESTKPKIANYKQVQKIKILLSNLLTYIIENEMNDSYGDIWRKMVAVQPPFTVEEAVNCMIKYWMAVFSLSLQKQCKLKLESFLSFLKRHRNDYNYSSEDFVTFVQQSLSLCIYIKNGFANYRSMTTECINHIQKCAE